jgi:hypothetical protein
MLPAQSWYWAGWQLWQVLGSMSALWDSVDDPEPEPQPETAKLLTVTARASVIEAT